MRIGMTYLYTIFIQFSATVIRTPWRTLLTRYCDATATFRRYGKPGQKDVSFSATPY